MMNKVNENGYVYGIYYMEILDRNTYEPKFSIRFTSFTECIENCKNVSKINNQLTKITYIDGLGNEYGEMYENGMRA